LDVPDAQHFGFLGGPPRVLKVAGSADQVELQLDSGRTLAVQVLEVSGLGLALIKFGRRSQIVEPKLEIFLFSSRWAGKTARHGGNTHVS
jgi:hypothetical protein